MRKGKRDVISVCGPCSDAQKLPLYLFSGYDGSYEIYWKAPIGSQSSLLLVTITPVAFTLVHSLVIIGLRSLRSPNNERTAVAKDALITAQFAPGAKNLQPTFLVFF
jgi:hypothetical protein